MRCSAWSSRGTWACSAALVALALAPTAAAHLSIDPATVETGSLVDLTLLIPNEDDALGVDRVTVGIPPAFDLDDAEAKPGWKQSRTGRAITWRGAGIPKGQYATFSIRGTAPRKPETVLFNVRAGDRRGKAITYRVGLDVTAHASEDSGARTLGKAAFGVAIAAVAIALVAGFLGLYLWLRPPPP
jgi:uncharacterized protein YcnI